MTSMSRPGRHPLRLLRSQRTTATSRRLAMEPLETRQLLAEVSGTIATDTVWTRLDSPFDVTGDVRVQPGVTLTIEPGVELNFRAGTGIQVRGRLLAEGTPDQRIRFLRASGQGRWDGLSFEDTLADSRIRFADMIGGDAQGEAVNIDHARLLLDHVVWSGTTGTILELDHPSLIVRNSSFPTSNGSEVIHGEQITGDEYLIIEGNTFANSNNGGDVIDFLGAERPGPVLQVLHNVFLGGGDDGLDLDGTDAHIEGNVFMNFHRNTSRATTSNAIATGLPQNGDPNRTEITVVRNIFIDNDHAILLKEDAFAEIENNLFLDSNLAVIQFNEQGGTAVLGVGRGADLRNNIFSGNTALFKNLIDQPTFRTELTANYNLLPNEVVDFGGTDILAHELGVGNFAADPGFVDAAGGDYHLSPTSPAIGAGYNGADIGAYVPAGPVVLQDAGAHGNGQYVFHVSGPGITDYRYRIDGNPLSELRPVSEPIILSDLNAARYSLQVVAMNSAGEWYTGQSPAFGQTSIELISPVRTRPGERLPVVARGLDWQNAVDTTFADQLDLQNTNELSETAMTFTHGLAALAPTVLATDTFTLAIGDDQRQVEVLADDFPTQAVSGTISSDTTWSPDIEYHVVDDLDIAAGATLTIPAGTRVLLGNRVNVEVRGALRSLGTRAQPNLFQSIDPEQPWGGIELIDGTSNRFEYTFFTNGGGDTSRSFGHSNSQPVIRATRGAVDCLGCYVVQNPGKAFAASSGRVNISHSVISLVDTGGEFSSSVATIDHTWLINIGGLGDTFVDDDNDGFYFSSEHASGEPSRVSDTFVIHTKDDGLDHNGARLEVERLWVDGTFHEGIAASNRNWVNIMDSVFMGSNQGVEAGYGGPDVTISRSVLVNNQNQTDPDSPITAGLRFGDGYDGGNGAYTGHISAEYLVLSDNGDNVRNYDGTIPGPKAGAIDIAQSLANDEDATDPSNLSGVPVFSPTMHLLRGSAGFTAGPEGMPLGRVVPAVLVQFDVADSSGDFNGDGTLDAADINLFCAALVAEQPDSRFDLDQNGEVNAADRDALILNRFNTSYGDANLDGRFDSSDLVAVFVVGQYEDAISGNSGWEDGDWNCDGDFGTADLVLAFQQGGYVAAAVDQALANWQPLEQTPTARRSAGVWR